MNDLKTVRDALESAKTFLGQTVYVRGYGEQQYSEVCVALSIVDRMIETPAPTEKVDLDALKRDLIGTSVGGERSEAIGWNACIDHLANTGRLR